MKAEFTIDDISDYIEEQFTQASGAIINAYKFAGLKFVKTARLKTSEQGGFGDITGNLRSSIGFIILKDGKVVEQNFEPGNNGTDKETGLRNAKSFAEELAENYPKGIALICVAGMEYAAAVEAKGKDVITGSSLITEQIIINSLQAI